ncbi:MAG: sulfotransferase [Alphaproteobacteria bacterium]|nr:sulfotransferase [Alphaproteobacteria bacterium]HPF46090.1 sulfotransferase [Emcibacteraceae bacterium]
MNIYNAMKLAVSYIQVGQFKKAEKILFDIITADDKFHPAFYLLGQLAMQGNRSDMAVQFFHRATVLCSSIAKYHRDLAEALLYIGHIQEAISVVQRAIQLNSTDAITHFVAGNAYSALGDKTNAIRAFKTAIELDPEHDFAHNNLGSLYEADFRLKKAKKEYEAAIKINNKNVVAQNNLATLLIAEGEIDKAKVILNHIIDIQPNYIEAHNNISSLKTYQNGDEHIEILLSLLPEIEQMPLEKKIKLHFNLGKVYADLKDYDKAFYHYQSSNNLNRATYNYDEEAVKVIAENIIDKFPKNSFKKHETTIKAYPVPIFVVGMPRSGTSLIEQILSSHSKVSSGGELNYLSELVYQRVGMFPENIKNIPEKDLMQIGNDYLQKLKKLDADAQYIVDKMPGNYQFAGLIAKILPSAFIINTNRNALDCCLSNYTQLFRHTIPYTNNLGELGRYYKIYNGLMDHWRSVLPSGYLYDIHYESVVANLEEEARKLINFIGLDWEESCLTFHKTKNTVRTASAAQVREPIYNSSIERWRVYEKHLSPLIEALEINT